MEIYARDLPPVSEEFTFTAELLQKVYDLALSDVDEKTLGLTLGDVIPGPWTLWKD